MRALSREFLPVVSGVVLCFAVGCGGSPSSSADAGMKETDAGVDAGTMQTSDAGNCAPTESRHHSYVQCGSYPTSVSRLIVMGDSISAGYGTTTDLNPTTASETVPYPGPVVAGLTYYGLLDLNNDTDWPTYSDDSLAAEFSNQNIPIVNVAVPGATTSSMISNPDQRASLDSMLFGSGTSVSGHSIAVITIGGNDLVAQLEADLEGQSSTEQQNLQNGIANVRQVITYLQDKTKFPDGVSIYLANVYDPSDGTGMLPAQCGSAIAGIAVPITDAHAETAVSDWANAYVSLAEEMGFSVVDARGGFQTHGVTASSTYFYADCIHPNDTGHNELRRLFFEAISGTYVATDE